MRNLKEAGVKSLIQTEVNLRKAQTEDKTPMAVEVQYPFRRTCWRSEGRWGEKESVLLPGDRPLEWKLCNCGMRLPKTVRNDECMFQGSADEAVVAVKL